MYRNQWLFELVEWKFTLKYILKDWNEKSKIKFLKGKDQM